MAEGGAKSKSKAKPKMKDNEFWSVHLRKRVSVDPSTIKTEQMKNGKLRLVAEYKGKKVGKFADQQLINKFCQK